MGKRTYIAIPQHVREQANSIVASFNRQVIKDRECFYVTRYSAGYLYLNRHNYGPVGQICRLKYQGALDKWDFAIYRYSKERYDPDEWFFPGVEHVDGTIAGALKAGLEAYPLSDYNNTSLLGRILSFLMGSKR